MDRKADPFEVFYHQHARRVHHRAALIVGARDAEDVAQEVFFSASRAAARGDLDLSAPAWGYLRKATYWAALGHLRRVIRERPAAEDKDIAPMDETLRGDPGRALDVRRQWAELSELLDSLPPERRIVWVMTEVDDMKPAEVAEELELPLGTVHTRLRLARIDLEAALARKRAEEKRTLGASSTLVMLPLSAEAIGRTARSLQVPELSDAAIERLWRRIQARREAEQSRVSDDDGRRGNPANRPPRASGPRLKSEGRDFAAIALGTVVGLLAAMALADTGGDRRVPVDLPHEQVAPREAVVVSPAAVESATVAPAENASSLPPLSGSSATALAEQMLVASVQKALEPPDPDPEEALRLLTLHAQRYPHSRSFSVVIERLRLEAQHLAEQKRQGRPQ